MISVDRSLRRRRCNERTTTLLRMTCKRRSVFFGLFWWAAVLKRSRFRADQEVLRSEQRKGSGHSLFESARVSNAVGSPAAAAGANVAGWCKGWIRPILYRTCIEYPFVASEMPFFGALAQAHSSFRREFTTTLESAYLT